MTLLWILVLLLFLFFAWWFGQRLDTPWPKVIAAICVVICLIAALTMIFPDVLNIPIHR